ncbi:MAG: GNAT family N-acetyltransferase [Candidatus Aminicenantales bacterium]
MAHSAWRDEYGISSFPNLYRPDFLKYLFDRLPEKDHLIAAYHQNEIVAFLANLPQKFHYQGKVFRAVYACLLVTRKEFLRRGMATALVNEALCLNRKYKYDFALFSLEAGHRSTRLTQKLKQTGNPVEWVKKMHVIARVLDLDRISDSEGLKFLEKMAIRLLGGHRPPREIGRPAVREYRTGDLDQCLALINQYQNKLRLALVWEREALAWELDYPDVAKTLIYEKNGRIAGLINFIFHDHLGKTKERWAWVNHVAYPDLAPREQFWFVQSFLNFIKEAGCVGAVEWTKKYYSLSPFYRARFFPYFRAIRIVSWTFNPDITLRNIPDVYEIQI